ncbi:hypothetical protein [uncultured Paludibaculum sp.]|uniref:hypothetical protein n=1 Tax=uncultured Paludibaculum sp. TaxID=1765020 RepID=UPI002AAB3034|nr:hypothetical protein [uncultured Paludibaculum sp.]
MSFYSRYELVKLVRNGEPKSFQAREIQTGRNVLLHLWGMGDDSRRSPLLLHLRDQMRTDPSTLMGIVVEVQEGAEPPYVVTAFDEKFTSLQEWISGKQNPVADEAPPAPAPAPVQPPPIPAAAPTPPAKAEPGEFTRMFMVSPPQPPAPQPAQDPVAAEFARLFEGTPTAPPAPPQPAGPPPSGQGPGQFTQMFGGSVEQPVSPAPQPPFQPQPPPPPAVPQPQQYRPMVNETPRPPVAQPPAYHPPVPPSPLQPPPPPPRSTDGDFTKLFGSPLGASPLPVEDIERGVVAPPPSGPASRPFSGPGQFTIQFGKESNGAPDQGNPPPPPAHSPLQGGATGLFSGSDRPAAPPSAQAAQPAGPSEFTRVLRGPHLQQSGDMAPAPPFNPPPMPGAVPLPPPPKKGNVLGILVAVLSFLLILLLITVVVLIFKK